MACGLSEARAALVQARLGGAARGSSCARGRAHAGSGDGDDAGPSSAHDVDLLPIDRALLSSLELRQTCGAIELLRTAAREGAAATVKRGQRRRPPRPAPPPPPRRPCPLATT